MRSPDSFLDKSAGPFGLWMIVKALAIVFRHMQVIAFFIVGAISRLLIFWPVTKLGHGVRELWRGQRTLDWYPARATVAVVRAKQKIDFWHVALVYHYMGEARWHTGLWSRTFVFERQVEQVSGAISER